MADGLHLMGERNHNNNAGGLMINIYNRRYLLNSVSTFVSE